MIKLIIFSVLLVIIVLSFQIDTSVINDFFSAITSNFNQVPSILNYIKDTFNLLFSNQVPTLKTMLFIGLGLAIIQYLFSLIGDEKK